MMEMDARRPRVISPRAALLTLLVGGLLFSSAYPVKQYFALRATTAELQAEETALDERIEALRAENALLQSPEEIERLAREELGMIRPGEVPFVIVEPRSQQEPPPAVASDEFGSTPRVAEEKGLLSRWFAHLRDRAAPVR